MAEKKFVYQLGDGVRRTMVYEDDQPDKFTINTEVDVTNLADDNKALRENHKAHSTNKLVARVPMTIYEQSVREQWDDAKWKQFLNDPDNKVFRVWEGRV